MRLKGQMIYVPETDLVLFLCSPSVLNLDDLNRRGLYLSDIPLHDSTRDLILLSEQFEAEYKLTKNLEILTDKLQQTYRELEDEKKKTDRYVLFIHRVTFLILWLQWGPIHWALHFVGHIFNDKIHLFFKDFSTRYYRRQSQMSSAINAQLGQRNLTAWHFFSAA